MFPSVEFIVPDVPVGPGILWFTNTAPAGWLLCRGQSLLRTDYPALFAVIGTTYGAVDGTHFTLPDLQQRFPLGKAAAGTGNTLGTTGGAIDHVHTTGAHIHGLPIRVTATQLIAAANASGPGSLTASWVSGAFGGGGGVSTTSSTIAQSASNTGTENPPFQVVNFAIKAF